jgi:hypothetical protein
VAIESAESTSPVEKANLTREALDLKVCINLPGRSALQVIKNSAAHTTYVYLFAIG